MCVVYFAGCSDRNRIRDMHESSKEIVYWYNSAFGLDYIAWMDI